MIITSQPESKKFEPFSVTLTFESIEEVQELWTILNLSSDTVFNSEHTKRFFNSAEALDKPLVGYKLWKYLDNKLKSL